MNLRENAKKSINTSVNINYIDDWKAELYEADIIIIATNWSIYKSINKLTNSLSKKVIFDTRSLLDSSKFNAKNYLSVD